MRIIHLASGDLWAGAEVQLFHLAINLNKQPETDLLVVLLNDGQLADELRKKNINVKVFDESNLSFFKIFREFYKLCRETKPNIIHTHRVKENIVGGVVSWLIRSSSARTVHGAQEFSSNIKSRVLNFVDDWIACLFQQRVIAVSHELNEKLQKHCFSSKLDIIENCVDIAYINKMAMEPVNYPLEEECFNVAFVGRFVDVKRTDIFIGIAEKLKEICPNKKIKFNMFGDGPLWDEKRQYVKQKNLDDIIHLAGFVDNSAPYLKKMDLLVFTSDHEGLPMTLLEAMVLKVPVLSRNLTTIKYVLCKGTCGYFVESDSIADFAKKILEVSDNKNERDVMKNNAYDIIENKYSINVLVERYMALYNSLI